MIYNIKNFFKQMIDIPIILRATEPPKNTTRKIRKNT